jgi:hypothetical protein
MQYADRIPEHGWLWALAGVIVVGLICMRGFGSRTRY